MILKNFLHKHELDAYIIFLTDEHDNEYVGESDNFLKYITGFTGSNGYAVILADEQVLYTDSRYFIQANRELKNNFRLMKMGIDSGISEFLISKNVKRVGYNPIFLSRNMFLSLNSTFESKGIEFVDINENPIHWPDRPIKIFNPVVDLGKIDLKDFLSYTKNKKCMAWYKKTLNLGDNENKNIDDKNINNHENHNNNNQIDDKNKMISGEGYKSKVEKIRNFLNDNEGYLLTLLDSIAWVFNLRGSDIPYNPLFYSYAYITKDKIILFTKDHKINLESVEIRDYSEFYDFLEKIKEVKIYSSNRVNRKIDIALGGKLEVTDFVENLKSVKNDSELLGFFEAAIKDGVALCRLFGWIQDSIAHKKISEKDVAEKLIEIKKEFKGFVSPSFESISAFGSNAAEVHHRSSDDLLEKDGLFLLDSGSQYLFGTTDITRTVCFGKPEYEHKKYYTLVLKGQLNAKMLRGPANSLASMIQNIPRKWLWKIDEDYGHSTSHGVGHYLNVHESPPLFNNSCVLKEKQVFSIEPGFYKENNFGIRIEDVVVSIRHKKFLEIKNLTLVPLHLDLIDWELLDKDEINYLNEYNMMVYDCLSDFLNKDEAGFKYLKDNTKKMIDKDFVLN
ncbi:putative Xaa-Pro aminopeptidase P [Dictyocoela muelleri]|nr:putative Xaa-Pro aminopeptidase P [Dictyocoela muelleri]